MDRQVSQVTLNGRIATPDGELVTGSLVLNEGRVDALREGKAPTNRLLLPGCVDLHVHGGGGGDVMDGRHGVAKLARFHLLHGTTSLCPTTVTAPLRDLALAVSGVACVPSNPQSARILGVHLEGPYLAEARRGAQPDHCRNPSYREIEPLLMIGPIAAMTLAPELPGALELIYQLTKRGVRVSLGHSEATYAQARQGFAAGARGATHLFNAMSGLHHREPGLAAAALENSDVTAELILDTHHVHPSMAKLALRSASCKIALVTDAIRATGLPDGESELGGQRVCVAHGRATLDDGTLAGSVLTLDHALRNAVALGLEPQAVSLMLSKNPADAISRPDLGRLAPGARADVLEVDADTLQLTRIFRDGVEVDLGLD